MKDELYELFEKKVLKKSDVKATERKLESDVTDSLEDNKEYAFLKPYLKNNNQALKILLTKYTKKLGSSKLKNDPNLGMLAVTLAAMEAFIKE